jgi:HEAT repeat protein
VTVVTAAAVGAVLLLGPGGFGGQAGDPPPEPPAPAAEKGTGPVLEGLPEEAARARAAERWKAGIASEEREVRLATVKAWEKSGRTYEELAADLLPLLADWKPDVREVARAAYLELGGRGVAVLVRDGLTSDDVEIPGIAIQLLGAMAEKGSVSEAVDALLAILGDPARSRALRERAATALGRVRPVEARVRAALVQAARDPNDEIAASAIEGLGLLGSEAEEDVPFLIALLADDERGKLHTETLKTLAAIGRRPNDVVPAIFRRAERLRLANPQGAKTIAAFGKESLSHVEAGLGSADEYRFDLALSATRELARELGASAASLAPPLARVLGKSDRRFRDVCWALQHVGPAAAAVVPDLVQLLGREPELDHRGALLNTLAYLGPTGVQAVRAALDSPEGALRAIAAGALMDARDAEEGTLARLKKMAAEDTHEDARRTAAHALKWLTPR